jgi:uncharacterized protein YndB with AHSA1/START domain
MPRRFEVRREVELEATPEQVWDAISTGPGLTAWFMPMEIDPDDASVVAWEPGRRLAIATPAGEDGSTQAFEFLVEGRDGGTTVLRFVHGGLTGDDWGDEYEPMTAAGWDMYLHTLAQYLRHFPGRPAVYAEAEGPPASASEEAWPVLLAALGGGRPLALEAEVHLELPGAAPLDGVVDHLSANFVGVRTADALVRFHGRWPLGMTVAVGHHAYAAGFDAGPATEAWTSWLAAVLAPEGAPTP